MELTSETSKALQYIKVQLETLKDGSWQSSALNQGSSSRESKFQNLIQTLDAMLLKNPMKKEEHH